MQNKKISIVFAGTAEIAVPTLRILSKIANILCVLTAPDRPAGRGLQLLSSPVKKTAQELQLENIYQPESLKSDARDFISNLPQKPDLLFVYAYGHIFGSKFLSLFPLGAINVHPSLLPLYRGPSPLVSAILSKDTFYGISIQKVALAVDSGDILYSQKYPLTGEESSLSLHEEAAVNSAQLVESIWDDLLDLLNKAIPQDESKVVFCHKIDKKDGLLDWKQSGKDLDAQIRAFQPWPKTWTTWKNQILYIYRAKFVKKNFFSSTEAVGKVIGIDSNEGIQVLCSDGVLIVKELQLQSKKRLDWKTFYNGNRDINETHLGG